MVPLRQAAAQFVRTGQLVAVHDRDVREGLGESTGGEKARHAPAEHYRAAFALSAHSDLLSFDKRSGNNKVAAIRNQWDDLAARNRVSPPRRYPQAFHRSLTARQRAGHQAFQRRQLPRRD
ncbi:hypothetical protein GCM10023177_65210 [Streptomyces violaceoruber]|nr:hypothetical protein JCM4020_64340 [Streptomyces coelicolor]